ncbi:MAG: NAD(P)/FAD-dependent oxidoreductase [Bacteroidetes bacterium]|uniref:NAD(P)/FAD-dependent oxidoreductase n=1 Tax=Phaeocystidibacter marisrubri TaxID=1577780 RepID=A0A6L3ZIA3_9FLAO|nr:NAD(P)/FAD-dependent oxidoreductase [Phaeocystidibacter marisrubri]KAB2817722.1 NAD(P)/FAD-dependent oxidoreductase [Phaeocystidibacter marisrubri]TNE30407.1 MAG: NAD(P)/FAD-dependent oxidoreductase [Bacteroidota bacterium]GGH73913.1 flavoprotein [Phaeocystidibacter marisrubri]
MSETRSKSVIIGGGAAGFFAAIACAEADPFSEVVILEKTPNLLGKVKISGGGRCNVTHACFNPDELVEFYPRGTVELKGPFHRFGTADTMEWFTDRGVELKVESDNRIFPVTDDSQTIVDCLTEFAERAGVVIKTRTGVEGLEKEGDKWLVRLEDKQAITADKVLIATGSSKKMWDSLKKLGHKIVPPVPSLFTFNVKDPRIAGLAGVSVPNVELSLPAFGIEASGPLLVTHWGLSGPAILRLSAWGARDLHGTSYRFLLHVNFVPQLEEELLLDVLNDFRKDPDQQRKRIHSNALFDLPLRLWKNICTSAKIPEKATWSDVSKPGLKKLVDQLHKAEFVVSGKSTFKDEFVTAGGIDLNDIDFRTFSSKLHENLFMAGEVLDIDAITGGFNFQAAWTGGWIAGHAMAGEQV